MQLSVLPFLGILLTPATLLALQAGPLRQFSKIEMIEIENKRNERGERLPPEVLPGLRNDVLYAVAGLHLFAFIDTERDPKVPEPATVRVVQMKMRIIGYSGAQNNARVTAVVHFVDKESGREILQKKVDAQLHFDSGALSGAMRKLARSTADMVKANW